MNLVSLVRNTLACLLVFSALSLASTPVFAIPIQPGVSILSDPQFQACFDEAVQANGWTDTEQVDVLACPDRAIESLGGVENFINLTNLDLSNNNLRDTYPLETLSKLVQLNLGGNDLLQVTQVQTVVQNNPGLTHLYLNGITLNDLNWLPARGPQGEFDFQELDFSNTKLGPRSFLIPLESYINLRVIKASDNQLELTFAFDLLTKLNVLDLSNNKLIEIIPMQSLNQLTHLNLSGNSQLAKQEVVTVVQNNPGLTHLNLSGISLLDLNWLPPVGPQNEFNILELDVSNTGLSGDLQPLASHINLSILKASDNQLVTAFPLDQLAQLNVVDLSNNNLTDIFALQALNQLSELNLGGNNQLQTAQVQGAIQNKPGLTHLNLSGISLMDLSWLPPMGPQGEYNILDLDVSNTGIRGDLQPLATYRNMAVLNAAGNQLESVFPLDQLTQLSVLDLSNNKLIDISPLQNLFALSRLSLAGNNQLYTNQVQTVVQNNPGLTQINLSGIALRDLAWLPSMGINGEFNLQELELSNTGIKGDLYLLGNYLNLRVLKVADNQLDNISQFVRASKLEILDLSKNNIRDISPLQTLQALTSFNISDNRQLDSWQIQTVVQNNPNLTHLNISSIAMVALYWLPPMGPQGEFDFQELDISNTGLAGDLFPLASYINLRVLNASGNRLEFVAPIDQLTKLSVLDLSNNKLVDIVPMQSLNQLTQLNLSGNSQIEKFQVATVVQNNPGLTHLNLSGITLLDLNWLPSMGPQGEFDIQELDISNAGLTGDLQPLASYINLRVLNASGNQLTFVFPLDQLKQLSVLDLNNNNLTDIFPLQALQQLRQLNLSGNSQLQSPQVQSVIQNNPGLTHLYLSGITLLDLNWLPPMGLQGEFNILELDISNTGLTNDLQPLASYVNMRVLNASGNQLGTVSPLELLKQLEVLDLSNNKLIDIYNLGTLNQLRELNLGGNNLIQADNVQNVVLSNPDLTNLNLSGIKLLNMYWFPALGPQGEYNFQVLDISNTGLTGDLYFLASHVNLRVLKASNNQLVYFGPVSPLEVLDLSNNILNDISALQYLNTIKYLNLSGNKQLQALQVQLAVQNNPGLTHINLSGISLLDLSWLPPMGAQGEFNIQEIDISNTGLTGDLFPLASYINLRVLNASGNQLEFVSPIDQLTQLNVLDLSNNMLVDIIPMQSLSKLTLLNLSGNHQLEKFQVVTVVQNNPGLTHLNLSGITLLDLNWLPPVGPQGEYNFQELDFSDTGLTGDTAPLTTYHDLRVLDLRSNNLTDIFPLQALSRLNELNLSGNSQLQAAQVQGVVQNNPGLTKLYLSGISLMDLYWLPPMGPQGEFNIQELDVSNTGLSGDLYPLASYINLRVLKATDNQLSSTYPLDQLTQLEKLDLNNNNLSDTNALQSLHVLTHLNLGGNSQLQASQVTWVVQNNPGLTHLNLNGISLMDLYWLPTMGYQGEFNFQELDVSNTGLTGDLQPLSSYINLRVLRAADNQLVSTFGLEQLTQLQVLDLSNNNLSDINALLGLKNLSELNLGGNSQLQALQVQTVVQNNPGLTHLNLSGIALMDLGWLPARGPQGEFDFLELNVSNTGLKGDLFPLASFINLHVLNVSGNQLEFVSPIDQLTQLNVLDLSNNKLVDIIPMQSLNKLTQLNLSGNNLLAKSQVVTVVQNNPGLTHLNLSGISLLDLNWLPAMGPQGEYNFQELDLSNTGLTGDAYLLTTYINLRILNLNNNNLQFVSWLGTLKNLTRLDLRGNNNIQCIELDNLEAQLSVNVLLRPQNCIIGTFPTVTIEFPIANGQYYTTQSIVFAANASDAEDGNLDQKIQWSSNLSGALGTGASFNLPLNAGKHVITSEVVDSHGNKSSTSVNINVLTNTAPELTINTLNGLVVNEGENVVLNATVNDLEDANLGQNVEWTSSLDGFIGTGSSLSLPLSVGSHWIFASITDKGVTVIESISITINAPPKLVLQSPANASLFMLQENVNMAATASDLEDGNISANIQWSSDVDGVLGSGSSLLKTLSLGSHVITASITDSAGAVHSVSTQVVIDQIALNVKVYNRGARGLAILTWADSRTPVDIYKNGSIVDSGPETGTDKYRFRSQAVFKVCETSTNYCSPEITAVAQ